MTKKLTVQSKKNAVSNSQNKYSKKRDSSSSKITEESMLPFTKHAINFCKENEYVNSLVDICFEFGIKKSNSKLNPDRVREVHEEFWKLLGLKCTSLDFSNGVLTIEQSDFDNPKEAVIVFVFFELAAIGINIEMQEKYDSSLIGLNSFILNEFPEPYKAYIALSNQFEFKTIVKPIDNVVHKTENEETKLFKDLLDLLQDKIYLNPLVREFDDLMTLNEIFLAICLGLGCKIKDEKNDNHQIDNILQSFSNLLSTKCEYLINTDGVISFRLKNGNLKEADDLLIIIFIGIISCFKVNLEFLEKQNPVMQGLKEYLSHDFPELYTAYSTLSNQFGFDRTINLELKFSTEYDEYLSFVRNMKIEKSKVGIAAPKKTRTKKTVENKSLS